MQVVVITGASSGIGEALAHAFHEQGSKVVLAARRRPELERVKQDLMSKNLVNILSMVLRVPITKQLNGHEIIPIYK